MKSYRKFAVILSALIVSSLLLTGCGKKDSSSNSVVYYDSNASSQNMLGDDSVAETEAPVKNAVTTAAEPINYTEGTIGDTLEQDGISATLEKAEITMEKTADNTILMYAVLDIKNLTDADISISRLENFSVGIDGAEPEMSTITSVTARSAVKGKITDIEKFDGVVTSGNSLKGYITFEVPVGASEIALTYYPYQYSDTKSNTLGYEFKFNVADMAIMK